VRSLWPAGLEKPAGRRLARPPGLLYAVDETPPRGVLAVAALQQVAVMSNSLAYPIILIREAGLSGAPALDLVSISMFALGVATVLFCANSRFVGCGYLCPADYTQIYLGPCLFAVKLGGLALAFGMTMVAGFIQLAMVPLLRRLRPLLPPEIAGLVIAIVGLSLASLGMRYSLGLTDKHGIAASHLAITGVSLATMIILNVWTRGYTKMFCALIGIFVGYAMSAAMGVLDYSALMPKEGLSLLHVPSFGHIGWRFDVTLLAPFAVIAIATTLRAMGDVSNAERLNDKDWVRPGFRALAGGVSANGLASIFCGLAGTLGLNTCSGGVGLSGATGITSRSVGYAIGAIFVLLSFAPAAAIAIAALPAPVIGASMFFSSAFVFIAGLQMITARLLDSRKTMVIGFSFAMAVMAGAYSDVFARVPLVLRPLFDNALVLGTVSAVLLNLIMRIGVRKRVSIRFAVGEATHDAVVQFLTEQGARWAARRDIVDRAIFGVLQLLDALEDVQSDIIVEASFDEFNLDIRVSYDGAVMEFPDKRPSDEDISDSEDGVRLLAGYMLRRNADRVHAETKDGKSSVLFHFDH
jgi:xanthine permease XanP